MIGLRKKICFLLPSHYSARMGGSEYQVKLIIDALCKRDRYDIHYLCRLVSPGFVPKGYKIRKVGSANGIRRFGYFFDAIAVYKAFKDIAPQIIYQNVGCAYTGVAARYAKKCGAKLIWHIAGDNEVDPQAQPTFKLRLRYSLEQLFLNYGIRNADIIVGLTQQQGHFLKKNFGRKCDVIIPVGHPYPRDNIKKPEAVSVLWVANLHRVKQPEIFVRLVKEFGKANGVTFIMMGRPGSGRWVTRLMEEIKVTSNLNYLGEVSQDEVNRRLSQGHIFVNTSRREGFPNTFVQAWMRKVPIVSLNVDPERILISKKIGFHSRTFESLSRDVRLLIENSALREEMGARAHRYAIENYTAEKIVQKVIRLFE